jgi:hypothetical protein
MRGQQNPQVSILAFVDSSRAFPWIIRCGRSGSLLMKHHGVAPVFDAMHIDDGRPSIPPERLLKASLLMSLYSVRTERAFCE